MDLQERILFQGKFIKELRDYPRSILFDLRDGHFKKAKQFFGESRYTGEQLIGFYKYLETDEEDKVQPIFMKYEDIRMYQYHMMAMCVNDGDPYQYLKDFHEYCKTLKSE